MSQIETLRRELDLANPQTMFDMLRKLALGTGLAPRDYSTGTISAVDHISLPTPAKSIESIQVVASGTAGSVGYYYPGDDDATPHVPAGAGQAGGLATVDADRKLITFPNTVTEVRVIYREQAPEGVDLEADYRNK